MIQTIDFDFKQEPTPDDNQIPLIVINVIMSIYSNIKRDNPEVNWQRKQISGTELLQNERK